VEPSQSVDVERWKRIEQVYDAALAHSPDQRSTFLDDACADDPQLRLEVESLVRANDHAGSFLNRGQLQAHLDAVGAPANSLDGRSLGPYERLSPIGAGAIGQVYVARDSRLGRLAALKLLHPHYTRDPSFVWRFIREAQAASALNHPNIITVYEIGEVNGTHFIATEFIEGVSLRDRLSKGRLDQADAIAVAIQCAAALSAAHRAGIVHRDVKPENIMLRPDGLVKVVDFGLARIATRASDAVSPAPSGSGVVMGTPRYMSPEQARGLPLDARTDIFSLGAVLYEMAVGQRRFPQESTAEVFASLLAPEDHLQDAALTSVDEPLRSTIAKALVKERDRRYQTMDELAGDLERARDRLGPVRRRDLPASELRWRRMVPAIVLGMIALAIAGRLAVQSFVPSLPPLSSVPLTSDPGYEFGPRLSPDGAQVAYTRGTRTSEPDVVVQGVGLAAQPQVVARRAFSAAWSPTGKTLAVLRSQTEDSARRDVLIVGLSQQPPRRIGEVDTPSAFADDLPSAYLDFSPDGRFVVASDGWGVDAQSYLVLISVESGEKFALTSPGPTSPGDFTPRFSPDGRRIAFTRILRPGVAHLHVLDLTSDMRPAGPSTEVASAGLWNAFPAWTADSRHLVFAGGAMDDARLKLVRVSGTSVTDLPLAETGVSAIDLGPGAEPGTSRIVYTRSSRDTDIFRASIGDRQRGATPNRATAIIESTFIDELPRYSPDGSRVAFLSGRSGSQQIWLARADGTEPRQLTRLQPGTVHIHGLEWSPDGKRLAIAGTLPGKAGIHEVDAATGALRLLVGDEADLPVYSADGQWLYFRIARQRAPRIWRMPAQGGTPELIETLPGTALQFTPDGGTLVYVRGTDLLMRPAGGGHLTQLFSSIHSPGSFAVTSGAVYAVTRRSPHEPWSLVATRPQDRRVAPIVTFEREVGDGISVSPDERHVLITQEVRQVLDVMTVDEVDLTRYAP